jgi:predicted phosphoribosyltransferase
VAIPRGGVVVGAVLAEELGAHLDVVLSRKLRAPGHPEVALGAISERGLVYLNEDVSSAAGPEDEYLRTESRWQLEEIARRSRVYRAIRPLAPVEGRSVIVTDDGIATGSTMIAALQVAREQHPQELIVAVPVAPPDRLEEVAHWCDQIICLAAPESFRAVGEFYGDFGQVDDEVVITLLRRFASQSAAE